MAKRKRDRESRYRTIDLRLWGDQWFRSLTPIPPCGAGLWIYFLTGPEAWQIPGLFRAGEAALAEALRWPIDDFRRAFSEVSALGKVQADWQARVVWIPNAIRYNSPPNPNVVKSWRMSWGEIAECSLKRLAAQTIAEHCAKLGTSFAKAFGAFAGNGIGNGMPNGSGINKNRNRRIRKVRPVVWEDGGSNSPSYPIPVESSSSAWNAVQSTPRAAARACTVSQLAPTVKSVKAVRRHPSPLAGE